ncbi:MAG: glycine--tRNA ligase subunit beta [Candidatus Syntrophonatronum acetioxidans]|uniref:Glycine--tRNA ligase beta subunit n=1 Tax=Candidatus Syntrophonatronum acetioxidans TaxID=1795816 RepID=A0A424YE39_9FIRM|nr:MAG: glycine--tRNA ligase subunit beta [Candidatus Syntrophonatronum acetioxidans]
MVTGVEEKQADLEEKKKGPARQAAFDDQGNPSKAAEGFARSQGVKVEDLTIEEFQGGEYVFATKKITGGKTTELLPEILRKVMEDISFPKPMYWYAKEVRFARPIRWILAVYGQDTVPFKYAGLDSGNQTRGHRFLAPGPFEVKDPGEYLKIMADSYVVVDQEKRKEIIKKQAEEAAESLGGVPLLEEELLDEVNYLVEYPYAVAGEFSSEFLEIPKEVLITSMQSHQRYFPVISQEGKLLPYFITISNVKEDVKGNVKIGNERVLKARLADAQFFFREDQKTKPDEYVEKLKDVIFQEDLGTLYDKTQRIKNLSEYMADEMNLEEELKKQVSRLAYLCKFDLMTLMVYEFPELQGIMGREYARLAGEGESIARGIYEHYLPRFAGDELPETLTGSLVSLGDKIDNIVGAFGIGIQPTGSQDPYALRRQALGIVYILLESNISLPLTSLVKVSLESFRGKNLKKTEEEILPEVIEFIRQRIRHVFLEKGLRYDLIDAVLTTDYEVIPRAYEKVQNLSQAITRPEFARLMTAFTRVANLAKKVSARGEVQEALLEEEAEKVLYREYLKVNKETLSLLQEKDYAGALEQMAHLQKPVDDFFDQVMVMVDDEDLRNNRLSLLRDIRDLFQEYADFSKVVEQ